MPPSPPPQGETLVEGARQETRKRDTVQETRGKRDTGPERGEKREGRRGKDGKRERKREGRQGKRHGARERGEEGW